MLSLKCLINSQIDTYHQHDTLHKIVASVRRYAAMQTKILKNVEQVKQGVKNHLINFLKS